MTDPNLFDDQQTPPQEPDYVDYVSQKYGVDNPDETLAKAIWHKDQHIEQVHRETAGLRQELNTRMKMEEFLDKMNSYQTQTDDSNDSLPADRENTSQQKPALSAEDVQRMLEQREHANRRNRNLLDVSDTLRDKLGPNFSEKVRQTVKQLGMQEAEANNLAAENPKAFYRLMGLDVSPRENFQSPPRTTVNSEGFRPSGGGQKDWAYFNKMMKEKPNEYWSPKVQNEIFQLTLQGKLDPNQ